MAPIVLVVDDEPLLLDMLCEMLDDLGCEAVCVDCPVKGLEKLATDERIALLISDVQMPIMDGFELANRARERRPDMPIVLMSGKELGRPGFPVIKKPFSRPKLAEILAPIVRS
jgi:two-component system cell cycle response regulator CpdR